MAEKIKITFLGTGSAIPTKTKNHPSFLISYKDQNLLFDCGEGTQRQIRQANISASKINKIFITHWHGDHTLGIPGLLQTLVLNNYNETIEIHGPIGTKEKMKALIDFHMPVYLKMFKSKESKFEIKVYEHKEGTIFENEEIIISCFKLDHGINVVGYNFILKEKLRIDKKKLEKLKIPNSPEIKKLTQGNSITVNNKKISPKDITYIEPSKKISYVSDTVFFKDLIKEVKNSDLLIIESTYSNEEKIQAKEHFHLTSSDVSLIASIGKVKTLAIVHLSQRYELNNKIIKNEAKANFKGKIILPNDLDSLEI